MIWENPDYRRMLFNDIKTYLGRYPDATFEEKKELFKWVMAGCSIGDNPYRLYDDDGFPMDFIAGCRIGAEMLRDFCEDSDSFPEKWGMTSGYSKMKEEPNPLDDLPF